MNPLEQMVRHMVATRKEITALRVQVEKALAGLPPQTTEPPQTSPLLSITEAASRLGISNVSVIRLADRGELESVHVGRRRLFESCDVEKFINARKAQPKGGAR